MRFKLQMAFAAIAFAIASAVLSNPVHAADVTVPCSVKDAIREDGTPIPDPAGVLFSYGTSADPATWTKNWRVSNWKNCTVKITGLDAGKTYYFGAKFYTASGEYSALSNVVSYVAPVAALPVPVLQ